MKAWEKRALRRRCKYCNAKAGEWCLRQPRPKDALFPVNGAVVFIPKGMPRQRERADQLHRSRLV